MYMMYISKKFKRKKGWLNSTVGKICILCMNYFHHSWVCEFCSRSRWKRKQWWSVEVLVLTGSESILKPSLNLGYLISTGNGFKWQTTTSNCALLRVKFIESKMGHSIMTLSLSLQNSCIHCNPIWAAQLFRKNLTQPENLIFSGLFKLH